MADTAVRKVGRYEVERELAEGGMGVVYLARQPSLERPVVLKRMRRELADDEEAAARFLREARTAAAIHHPNVVGVYDCFTWRDVPYIACEYVDGLDAQPAGRRTIVRRAVLGGDGRLQHPPDRLPHLTFTWHHVNVTTGSTRLRRRAPRSR